MTTVNRRVVLIVAVMIPLAYALVFHQRVLFVVMLAVLAPLLFRTVAVLTRLVEPDKDDLHWICLGAPLRTRKGTVWVCPDCDRSYVDTGWRWLEQERVTTP